METMAHLARPSALPWAPSRHRSRGRYIARQARRPADRGRADEREPRIAMAHVNESDASAATDSTAFRVRTSAFVPRGTGTGVGASPGWAVQASTPAAPASAPADGTVTPASFEAASARRARRYAPIRATLRADAVRHPRSRPQLARANATESASSQMLAAPCSDPRAHIARGAARAPFHDKLIRPRSCVRSRSASTVPARSSGAPRRRPARALPAACRRAPARKPDPQRPRSR